MSSTVKGHKILAPAPFSGRQLRRGVDPNENVTAIDLLSLNRVCRKLGRSRAWVYMAMRDLGLPAIRLGSRWMFSNAMVDGWLASLASINTKIG